MANVMTVRVPDELQNLLKKSASEHGLTRNALVLHILWEWADKNGSREKINNVERSVKHNEGPI